VFVELGSVSKTKYVSSLTSLVYCYSDIL